MRLSRPGRLVVVGGGLLLGFVLCLATFVGLLLDWGERPLCHKQIMLSFEQWQAEERTDAFPNVDGGSRPSLSALRQMLANPAVETKYRYVAGLRADDPGDLVLMYLAQPTRWIWHGRPRTRLAAKGWMVLPVDFACAPARAVAAPGECSERLSNKAFASRLRSTLDFVRTNQRPNWETVIAEHAAVIAALDRHGS
jgi:hypothetical protein